MEILYNNPYSLDYQPPKPLGARLKGIYISLAAIILGFNMSAIPSPLFENERRERGGIESKAA